MTWPLLVAAVVPSALLLWYFLSHDLHPEPRGVLLRTFGLGVLVTVPAALAEMAMAHWTGEAAFPPLQAAVSSAFLGAALCEEGLKFLVVWLYCRRQPAFDEPMDGLVYGATASLGFATLENVLYVSSHGMGTAIVRALMAVPGHACWGAIMGSFIAQAHFGPPEQRARSIALALAVPMTLHGIYDFPLMWLGAAKGDDSGAVLWVFLPVAVVALGWRQVRARVRTLAAQQAADSPDAAVSPDARWMTVVQPTQGRGVVGVLQLCVGAMLAACGGLVTLLVMAGAALGAVKPGDFADLATGTVALGILPTLLGVWLFYAGLVRGQPRSPG